LGHPDDANILILVTEFNGGDSDNAINYFLSRLKNPDKAN
jgi:hypothetical protein